MTSQLSARYFLEVNAGELAGIEPGASVSLESLVTEGMAPAASDLVSAVVPFVGFLTVGAITTLVMRDMVKDLFDDEKSFLLQKGNDTSATCEIVRPQDSATAHHLPPHEEGASLGHNYSSSYP